MLPADAALRIRAALLPAVLLVAAIATSNADAQQIRLEIRPRPGDTIYMRLDQQVEMTGTSRIGDVDSTMSVVTNMLVLARTMVIQSDTAGTTVRAVTDSISVTTTGAYSSILEQGRRLLQGQYVNMRVAPDGSATITEDAGGPARAGAPPVAQMPATLPTHPVTVGESWSRTVYVPLAEYPGAPQASTLKATFRLDSISPGGRFAHISIRGSLSREDTAARMRGGGTFTMTGNLSGTIVVDRQRGWMSYSRTIVTTRSMLSPPEGSQEQPLLFQMRMTQRLRAMDKY